MDYKIKEEGKFKYIEEGQGEAIVLLHGLFGALSNFQFIIEAFRDRYTVVVPLLPLFDLSLLNTTVKGLANYVEDFIDFKGYSKINLLGNSLGGHVSLLYALKHQDNLNSMILTGSSGLFENAMSNSFPKRGNYEFIKEKTEFTFYDPKTATKELVDEVFETVNNRKKVLHILSLAKSAIRHNVGENLRQITVPSFLIWGKQDKITPIAVGEEFNRLLPNSELKLVDKCGHAPMMEQPEDFNRYLDEFLSKTYNPA